MRTRQVVWTALLVMLSVSLVAFRGWQAPAPQVAEPGECVVVEESAAPVRLGPNISEGVLGYADVGEALEVISVDDFGWVKIVPPDQFSNFPDLWVFEDDVEAGPCQAESGDGEETTSGDLGQCVVVAQGGAPVRLGPTNTSSTLGYVQAEDTLEVISTDEFGWVRIVPPDQFSNFPDLWVFEDDVEAGPCQAESGDGEETTSGDLGQCVVVAQGGAPVRLGANISASLLGYAQAGDTLEVISTDEFGWVKIVPPDQFSNFPDLWVFEDDVEAGPCEAEAGDGEETTSGDLGQCVVVAQGGAPVRLGPTNSSGTLGYVQTGETLEVISADDFRWVKIVPPDQFSNFPDLWVFEDDIEAGPCEAESGDAEDDTSGDLGQCVVANAGGAPVWLGPNTSAAVLGYFFGGEGAEIISTDDFGWVKIVPPDQFSNFPDLWVFEDDVEPGDCA